AVQHRFGYDSGRHRERVTREFGPQHGGYHLGETLHGLEHDISDETVAHNDVDGAFTDIVALDVAIEIEPTGAQQLGCTLHDLIALYNLFADIEQTDGGPLVTVDGGGQRGTHDGELQE